MKQLRAILFDLGGTLFSNRDIPRVCMPVLKEAARRLDVEGGLARVGPAFLEATRVVNADYVGRPFYLHRDLFVDTARHLVELLDLEASDDFGEWFYAAQRDVMVNGMALRHDCLETLETLRARGLSLAIVSNIDEDFLVPMLEHLDLRPYVDHWISSERAGSCKPDARIFHVALERTSCGPEEALFVGDSRVHDIQGARAVGLRSVLITEEDGVSHLDDESFEAEPDHVIQSLSELPGIVANDRAAG